MRKVLCLVAVASLVTVSMSLPASADGASDVPAVWNAGREDGANNLTVRCWPIAPNGARARVSCAISETTIKKPDPSETAKNVAEAAKVPAAELLKGCNGVPWSQMPAADAHDRAIVDAVARACAAHDANSMRKAFTDVLTDIAPVSCEVDTFPWPDLEVFEQVDADTWIQSGPPRGTCHLTSVLTLARKSSSVWTFSQVETVPDNAGCPTSNHRWSAFGMHIGKMGCKYIH